MKWTTDPISRRSVIAEHTFWRLVELNDCMKPYEWKIVGDVWTRQYVRLSTNQYEDVFTDTIRIEFSPSDCSIVQATNTNGDSLPD